MLAQHQAALTLLAGRMSAPGEAKLRWLDLACGQGQIIMSLDEVLSAEARARIEYSPYDLDHRYARATERVAEGMGFAAVLPMVGELAAFHRYLPENALYDFITLTNTVHEIEPRMLAQVLINSLLRLSERGTLFVYDMERLNPLELGAVPWTRDEIRGIVNAGLAALGAAGYRPEVGRWTHRTCDGWNVQLDMAHLGVTRGELASAADQAIAAVSQQVSRTLTAKMASCRASLEAFTKDGAATTEEQEDKQRLLFDFWAISRAMERER